MRALALAAAAFCAGMMVAAPVMARPWNDTAGRVSFDLPSGWAVTNRSSANMTYVIVGTANDECHVVTQANAVSATAPPRDVRHTTRQAALMSQDSWTRLANSVTPVFPGASAQYQSHSMDDSGFWAVHRAELRNNQRAVHAAFIPRPGFDTQVYCMSYGSNDPVAAFNTFINSVGNPNDATWRSSIEAAAPPAATTPAPTPTPTPAPTN